MPDYATLSELLAAQGEKKLVKLQQGIRDEIQRLAVELKLVEEALNRKRRAKSAAAAEVKPVTAAPQPEKSSVNGRFEGLPRAELLRYVAEIGRPVPAPEVQQFLVSKGIVRTVEAVRTGLGRLVKDGDLERREGTYFVPFRNGDGQETDAGDPLSRDSDVGMPGGAPPGE